MGISWREKAKSWGGRLLAVVLIMCAMFYGVLYAAQSSKEPMRKGLEDYLTQATGHHAEITDLERVRLIPNVVFVMRGVVVRQKDDPDKTLLKADQVFVAKPFLHLIFGLNDFQALDVQGLEIAGGFGLPKKLVLSSASIVDKNPKVRPSFVIAGTYNAKPVLITADLQRKMARFPLYSFGKIVPMSFKIGALEGEGTLTRGFVDVILEKVTLRHVDMGAEFSVAGLEKTPLNAELKGAIEEVPFNGVLTKSGQFMVLTVDPGQSDDKSLKRIEKFLDAVKMDLGLEKEGSGLEIVLKNKGGKIPQELNKE